METDLMKLIYKNYEKYTNSERVIADYILDNFNYILYDTLNILAQKIGVSTTSIIRFAKNLGFNGYSDLQDSIRSYSMTDDPFNMSKNFVDIEDNNVSELFESSLNKDIENLKNTLNSISKDDLESATQMLAKARKVYIIGMNDSFTLAYYMALRLGQVRENVYLLQSVGGMYPIEITSSNEEDLIVAYLFPRYSLNTINIIKKVKSNNGKVLIITSNSTSRIKDLGDLILPTFVHGVGIKESLIAPVSLSSYLASAVALVNPEKSKEIINYTERILQTGYYLDNR